MCPFKVRVLSLTRSPYHTDSDKKEVGYEYEQTLFKHSLCHEDDRFIFARSFISFFREYTLEKKKSFSVSTESSWSDALSTRDLESLDKCYTHLFICFTVSRDTCQLYHFSLVNPVPFHFIFHLVLFLISLCPPVHFLWGTRVQIYTTIHFPITIDWSIDFRPTDHGFSYKFFAHFTCPLTSASTDSYRDLISQHFTKKIRDMSICYNQMRYFENSFWNAHLPADGQEKSHSVKHTTIDKKTHATTLQLADLCLREPNVTSTRTRENDKTNPLSSPSALHVNYDTTSDVTTHEKKNMWVKLTSTDTSNL